MYPTPPIINIRNWDEAYSSQDIFYTHPFKLYTLGPCHAFCPASLILPHILSDSFIKHKVDIESEHDTIRNGNVLLLQDSWEAEAEGWLEAIPGDMLDIHHKKCGEWREEHMRKGKEWLC